MSLLPVLAVRVLLVSRDIQIIEALCHFMESEAMHVEVCSDLSSAIRKLCHSKYDGVAIDFKEKPMAVELLAKIHETTAHRGAVVLGILEDDHDMLSAFRAGTNFVLVRPLSPTIVSRTLRAAYPLMVREKRRYFRCPVTVPVSVSSNSNPDRLMATSANISEGGMALKTQVALQVGDKLRLSITLPGLEKEIKIMAEVCWSNNTGIAGVEFVRVPMTVKEELQSWLSDRLLAALPERRPCPPMVSV